MTVRELIARLQLLSDKQKEMRVDAAIDADDTKLEIYDTIDDVVIIVGHNMKSN